MEKSGAGAEEARRDRESNESRHNRLEKGMVFVA